jgi:D-glutamate N-acetyltransferase|tara:strand:- start:16252 stop:17274 length:1023 start_codon:yes stop_codon:yes gene_type:complete
MTVKRANQKELFKAPYQLFLGCDDNELAIKTSRGIAQWNPDVCVAEFAGGDSTLSIGLPKMSIKDAAAAGAKTFVIGLANAGGFVDPAWEPYILEAIENGMDVASGLHRRLDEIPSIKQAAEKHGAQLHDVRHGYTDLKTGTGVKRSGKRILSVGTDCSVGKMFTTLAIAEEMKKAGYDAEFKATGQTGVMIVGSGICIDAVVADFISGGIEELSPDNADDHWDIIEGQGSLYNPAFAGVSLGLLHGAQADIIVMCHEADRPHIKGMPHMAMPEMGDCIDLNLKHARLTNPDAKLGGISLNCRNVSAEEGAKQRAELQAKYGVPCFDPMITGAASFVEAL